MSMLAAGDWGGRETPPFYSEVELANANAMAGLMKTSGQTAPSFGLLMGDNFYSHGIDCRGNPDPNCVADSHSSRFEQTFEKVFDQPAFNQFPFYVILGNHDHYGNATAQLEYSQQHMGTGRWKFPAVGVNDLYYKLEKPFTDADGNSVDVDIFMIDTVQWAGLTTQCYETVNTTDQNLQMLWRTNSNMSKTFDEAIANCVGQSSCCLVDEYYNALPPPPPPADDSLASCPPPVPEGATGCARSYDSNDLHDGAHTAQPDWFAVCGTSCCRAGHNDPCHYTANASAVAASSQRDCTTPAGSCAEPPGIGGPCNESAWPDKDHGIVCGECKVLVNHFYAKYGSSCGVYCASLGRLCLGAWEESGDTCAIQSTESCSVDSWEAGETSDAICECGPELPAERLCVDNATPIREATGYDRCSDAYRSEPSLCDDVDFRSACCATCTPVTDWCAANGIDEDAWSVRAGYVEPFLQFFGHTCAEVVSAGDCDVLIADLSTSALGTDRVNAFRIANANPDATVANFSCPQACGICPKGDGMHIAPKPANLPAQDWSCDASSPLEPVGHEYLGQQHVLRFSCPDKDPQIGGDSENAATWSHAEFEQRQRRWLENELRASTADWKVVVGHYPVWSIAEHGPTPQMVYCLPPDVSSV